MSKSRYYWSRLRTGPKSGTYRVFDRVLEIHVAECNFKENAELVVGALNFVVSQIKQDTSPQVKANEQSSKSNTKSAATCPNRLDHADYTGSIPCPDCGGFFPPDRKGRQTSLDDIGDVSERLRD